MNAKLRRRLLSGLAIILIALCAAGFTGLALSSVVEKDASLLAQGFLVLIGVGGVVATLAVSKDTPVRGMPWRDWLQPRPLAAVFIAILAGFSAMSLALPLFEPRLADKDDIRDLGEKIDDLRPETPEPARILTKIDGLWGEPGCKVAYRFALKDTALVVDGERRPPGAPPWRLVATVTGSQGDALTAVGESPEPARGAAVTFTYVTNGVTERLTWDDQSRSVPLELDRC